MRVERALLFHAFSELKLRTALALTVHPPVCNVHRLVQTPPMLAELYKHKN